MGHCYDITIQFHAMPILPDLLTLSSENIHDVQINCHKATLYLSFCEHDDETTLLTNLAEMISMMQSKCNILSEKFNMGYQVKAADLDGLEDYGSDEDWHPSYSVFPHKDKILLSTKIENGQS